MRPPTSTKEICLLDDDGYRIYEMRKILVFFPLSLPSRPKFMGRG